MSLTVNLNGKELVFDKAHIRDVSELVNLVQLGVSQHEGIVCDISLKGGDLSSNDWSTPLSELGEGTLEISTTTKAEFVENRLKLADSYMNVVAAKFNMVTPTYKEQGADSATACLITATKDMSYFCDWFSTIVQLDAERLGGTIKAGLSGLLSTSEGLLDMQMSNKWEEICKTVDETLMPQLIAFAEEVEGL
jgi:hypothetical protein